MDTQPRSRHRVCGALAALCAAILPVAAGAQDPDDRSDRSYRASDSWPPERLQRLKSELGEAKQQLRQSRSEAQPRSKELGEVRGPPNESGRTRSRLRPPSPKITQTALPPQMAVAAPSAPPGQRGSRSACRRPTDHRHSGWPGVSRHWRAGASFFIGGYFQNRTRTRSFPAHTTG